MGLESKHPLVSEVVPPQSARSAVPEQPAEPIASPVESATPHLAVAQADLEAERLDDGRAENGNARERAIAGHRAPDTVDLEEARIRTEDNEAALRGTGGVPETTTGSRATETATPAKPKK